MGRGDDFDVAGANAVLFDAIVDSLLDGLDAHARAGEGDAFFGQFAGDVLEDFGADLRPPQADIDDVSPAAPVFSRGLDLYAVTDPRRLVGDKEDAGEGFLGGQANRNSDDARAGEEGGDFDSVDLEDDQGEDEDEEEEIEAPDEVDQTIVEIVVGGRRHAVESAQENEADKEVDEERAGDGQGGLLPGAFVPSGSEGRKESGSIGSVSETEKMRHSFCG